MNIHRWNSELLWNFLSRGVENRFQGNNFELDINGENFHTWEIILIFPSCRKIKMNVCCKKSRISIILSQTFRFFFFNIEKRYSRDMIHKIITFDNLKKIAIVFKLSKYKEIIKKRKKR